MKYGLPYQGSKNKLAERIVSLLPQAEHLIDAFCGGCAVSHAALLRGKYPHIHINDVDWRPVTLFQDALEGKYANEDRWISREDFFKLKDTDPYVAVVWSFANNMRDYLYSKEVEPLKRAIHYAMFYGDYEPGRELGHDFSFIDPIRNLQQRYLAIKRYFRNGAPQRQQSFEGGGRITMLDWRVPRGSASVVEHGGGQNAPLIQSNDPQNCNTSNVETAIHRLQYRERHHSLPQTGGQKQPLLTASVGDYRNVYVPDDSVLYLDPPYKGTRDYEEQGNFDYEAFYDWCEKQEVPVFISSYDMPADRFRCIEEYSHRSTFAANSNNAVTERIFIPIRQEPPKRPRQLELF